ncbi:uncharacterized protein LOC127813925 isoform X2 [Diospyros lotus]|uniref:uncharacterized protein LOC127813925 isoform X2 n=1 Tax=Diospyros lotus TaxID=55363 RepID=UPI002254E8F9|nr:uncharacterized protein LOC127813925 isoform X2 [Diospyros lotus]
MGSSSSKTNAAESSSSSPSSSSSSSARRSRSKGSRAFQSSCLGPPPASHDSDNDDQVSGHQSKRHDCNSPSANEIKSDLDQVKAKCYKKVIAERADETACISSNPELDDWGQSNLRDTVSGAGSSSSRAISSRSLSASSRFLSRFSLCPGNASFGLSRATSLGSSEAYRVSSTRFTASNEQEELQTCCAHGFFNRNETSRGRGLLPSCLVNRSPTQQHYGDFASGNLGSNPTTTGISDCLQDDQGSSALNVGNPRGEFNLNLHSPVIHSDIDNMEARHPDRRIGAREPVERNVRFSRTLSVGRLRDRVLRRSSFPGITAPLQQAREVIDASHHGGSQALGSGAGALTSNETSLISSTSAYASSGMSSSLYTGEDYEVENSRAREARYHDLLEHRSNFLERRRRIRSQVRALQRMGNRFENLSGHERSCIISGQHRTGHCTCRISNRDVNSSDDASARASISRIVMLAEALFEQSVVLSSRPSVSSIGSVPAPNEVVESLPVISYSKLQKHLNEEAAQCYICLVEYEEGDSLRMLPCHHEFHRTCIDKWLKEIHRVCPLCRGDICSRPEPVPLEN